MNFFDTMQDKLNATSLMGSTIETIGVINPGEAEVRIPATVYRGKEVQKILWGQQSKRDKTVKQFHKNVIYISKTTTDNKGITGIVLNETQINYKERLEDSSEKPIRVNNILHEDSGSYVIGVN